MPAACPIIPEQESFTVELRHVYYFSHRIIFHIDESKRVVSVLRVYGAARDALSPSEVELP